MSPSITDELERRVRRDLARGRRIVRLTWVAALVSLFLGLVAIRQAAFLVSIDRDLVTTEEVQGAGAAFDIARLLLVGIVIVGVILAVRWLRAALPVFAELRDLGMMSGPPRNRRAGAIGSASCGATPAYLPSAPAGPIFGSGPVAAWPG